ncbi:MAG: response regulator transcription factor [Deltaproteobacteria bacterium]|nr:response regulator transcription factor [Deltaproteobacteria bacterium]
MDNDRENSSKPLRVLIVDDHPAVRQGLGLLLGTEGITVCAEAGGCAEALARVDEHQPDVVLVDLSLGDEDGFALLEDLRERALPSLVYSMHEDGRRIVSAFSAGALGYVTKREVHGVLALAIREVAAGRRFVSPRAAVALAQQAISGQTDEVYGELSRQEKKVYRLLGQGETTKQIAAAMDISTRTVESYCARILVKLGLEGMSELRRHAISYFHKHTF